MQIFLKMTIYFHSKNGKSCIHPSPFDFEGLPYPRVMWYPPFFIKRTVKDVKRSPIYHISLSFAFWNDRQGIILYHYITKKYYETKSQCNIIIPTPPHQFSNRSSKTFKSIITIIIVFRNLRKH